MAKTKSFLFILLLLISTGIPSARAWTLDIEETGPNIFDVVLKTDVRLEFRGGTGSFLYDNQETLDWTYNWSFPAPLMEIFGSAYEEAPGDITNLSGAVFGVENYAEVTGDVVLGTFTFSGTGDANFRFDMDDPNMIFTINDMEFKAIDDPEIFGGSGEPPFKITTIDRLITNIGIATAPIQIKITPTQSHDFNLDAESSDTTLLPTDAFAFRSDANVTEPLDMPVSGTAGEPVTVYLTAEPVAGLDGNATITVTASAADAASRRTAVQFNLTVGVVPATLSGYDPESPYIDVSRSLERMLQVDKAPGSAIRLQLDGQDHGIVCAADLDGLCSIDVTLPDAGTAGEYAYDFKLLNQVADREAVEFADGTFVLDLLAPQVPITAREIVRVARADEQTHQIFVRAREPDGADSTSYRLCVEDMDGFSSVSKNYSTSYWDDWAQIPDYLSIYYSTGYLGAYNGSAHTAAFTTEDKSGNVREAPCTGRPFTWRLDVDNERIDDFLIERVESSATEGARIEIGLNPAHGTGLASGGTLDARLWARSSADGDYTELNITAEQADSNYVFKDTTTPVQIRSYMVTDRSGADILLRFAVDEEADTEPQSPQGIDEPSTDSGSSGGGGGGGGCFIGTAIGR